MNLVKTKDRVVTIGPNEEGYLLIERVRFVPQGYTKAKWDESRIWLSADEAKKLAEFVLTGRTK